ncbi:hypothetical protein BaRGS_00019067 [Batillaria attramentaria]|uniref:Uncharacterized protein n=1 Tax=Batillaria attramentaria TaxID=370345 RepID=A0ABD0KS19_9CAEN
MTRVAGVACVQRDLTLVYHYHYRVAGVACVQRDLTLVYHYHYRVAGVACVQRDLTLVYHYHYRVAGVACVQRDLTLVYHYHYHYIVSCSAADDGVRVTEPESLRPIVCRMMAARGTFNKFVTRSRMNSFQAGSLTCLKSLIVNGLRSVAD